MNNNPFVKPIVIVLGVFAALFIVGKFFAPKDPPPPVAASPDPASAAAEVANRKAAFAKKDEHGHSEGEHEHSAGGGEKAKLGAKAVTTKTGLKYEDLVVGAGKEAKNGVAIEVHYTGWLTDGKKFDSSLDRNEPYGLTLPGNVIPGWNEGILGMKEGGKRKLVIPAALGYGEAGSPPDIPPGATLVFEIELVKVN